MCWKSYSPMPKNVTVFGDKIFEEVNLNELIGVGLFKTWLYKRGRLRHRTRKGKILLAASQGEKYQKKKPTLTMPWSWTSGSELWKVHCCCFKLPSLWQLYVNPNQLLIIHECLYYVFCAWNVLIPEPQRVRCFFDGSHILNTRNTVMILNFASFPSHLLKWRLEKRMKWNCQSGQCISCNSVLFK